MKHKKRTYRKEQPKETLVVWDILKNETVAFLDTEYVTTQQKHGRPAKLVSVGMVICRGDFEEVDITFSSFPMCFLFLYQVNIIREI